MHLKLLCIEKDNEISTQYELLKDVFSQIEITKDISEIKNYNFDVILISYEKIKILKEDIKTPIILLIDKEKAGEAINYNVDGYLFSPISKGQLNSILNRLLKYIEERQEKQKCQALLKKNNQRLNKIIKQSDKQQLLLMKLNEKIKKQEEELRKIYEYDKQQQIIAKKKLDATIVNDLKSNTHIIYKAADILSGDFYSIYKLKNGAILAYIVDGQGHGIPPSLTVFAISSAIQNLIENYVDFETIIELLFNRIRNFLGEIEQLSYTFLYINGNTIKYSSGGMYPFLVKNGNNIKKYKVNNLPFMRFYNNTPNVSTINISWDGVILYSDGLVEDSNENIKKYKPENLLKEPYLFEKLEEKLKHKKCDDDITIINITNLRSKNFGKKGMN